MSENLLSKCSEVAGEKTPCNGIVSANFKGSGTPAGAEALLLPKLLLPTSVFVHLPVILG